MNQLLRQHGLTMTASRLIVSGLLLALGCGQSDSEKQSNGAGGSEDGGGGSSASEGGMTSGTSSSSGDNSNGTNTGVDESCGGSPFGAEPVKVNILVLLDRSKSMTGTPPGFTADKWTVTKGSLGTALNAVKDELAFGLQLFPSGADCTMPADSDTSLTVAMAPGSDALPGVVGALDSPSNEPAGGTPTAAALKRALAYFTTGAGATLEGERYILLATDGGPNCNSKLSCGASSCLLNMEPDRCSTPKPMCCASNCCDTTTYGGLAQLNCLDDVETLAQVKALKAAGISTFVVGIPGSETFASSLDSFAVAGGVPNSGGAHSYFAVDAPDALTAVLSSITKSLVTSCRLQLESVPPALDQLNVKLEGEIIPRGAADGWDLDEGTSPPTVVIQGASCARIESQGVKSVEVIYGCPTVTIL